MLIIRERCGKSSNFKHGTCKNLKDDAKKGRRKKAFKGQLKKEEIRRHISYGFTNNSHMWKNLSGCDNNLFV